ncbi:asparagine synthetase domain-containing protein CG17486 isoform X3 [Eurosta solidaginis]|uniref:asparagine synthetase domain-containing protein CG17486 isoform X3 n=1 Tax=Eurosta solidaginis TaxID=178769 RepID=UPI0035317CD6
MCGIFCGVNCRIENCEGLQNYLKRRGPDFNSSVDVTVDKVSLQFACSILWQQGTFLCSQPFHGQNYIMLLNGDIFNIPDKVRTISDTEWFGKMLSDCTDLTNVCQLLQSLEGPFSLIFFNKTTHDLYICRDSLGRTSLIVEKEKENIRFMSISGNSKGSNKIAMELPPLGLFKINIFCPFAWQLYPWNQICGTISNEIESLTNVLGLSVSFGEHMKPNWMRTDLKSQELFNFYEICKMDMSCSGLFESLLRNSNLMSALNEFSNLIERSVKDRVLYTPPRCKNCLHGNNDCSHTKIAVLFSGGIDCSILAAISNKYIPARDPIDLINVAFQKVGVFGETSWDVPDRISAKTSLVELQKLCPQRRWNYVEVNVSREELRSYLQNHIKHLIYPLNTILDESLGSAFWFASRGKGKCLGREYTSPARGVWLMHNLPAFPGGM